MNPAEHCYIHMEEEKCVGCNRCIRVCPIETANIAFEDESGNIRVRLDQSQCIYCGACIGVCDHGARVIDDDTERFFADLARGVPISVMAAPSIQTNIPEWKRLFAWLRRLGVAHIYDVSLGADICIWAHLRLLEKDPRPIITQPCPTIVSYCERHRHELLPYLSPIHSPMACAAVYMRQNGVAGSIASISPCIAKGEEHRETGLVQYNITFARLYRYLEANGITLPEEESSFDHPEAGPGALFPLPGGLQENLEFFTGASLHVEKKEGPGVFSYLDQYAATDNAFLPDVFDVLHCADGCLIGSAAKKEQNVFALHKQMQEARKRAARAMENSRERLAEYDRQLNLDDFLRTYTAYPVKNRDMVSDQDIERAFQSLGKTDFDKRHFNCGACGSHSCHEMARKIALNVNIPMNCVIVSRDEAKQERERNAEYLALVRNVGDSLFSAQDGDYPAQVKDSLRILSETVNCSAVAIWRRAGNGAFERVNGWYGNNPGSVAIYGEWPEDWVRRLKHGERVLVNARKDKPGLFPGAVTTLFIVPIHIRGEFWGFVDAISVEDREFAEEEASLLEAAGILLISGILERELHGALIKTREDALAGTRAKSDFLSRMSHEIRTPMNAIIGMTHMGVTAREMERKDYCLEKISNASEHLLGVINDILDMSKIEADKFELSTVWFNFEKMLRNVVNVTAFRMEEKDLQFSVLIDPRIPPLLEADDQRLAQVITNLLSNAAKFTPEGGRIQLSISLEERVGDLETIRVAVTDTGIGISDEAKSRLFQSFEQAESGTSRKFGGTGLGLAISRRIVELMGGSIWVESAEGQGSAFIFTFRARARAHDKDENARDGENSGETGTDAIAAGCAVDHPDEGQAVSFAGRRVLLAEDVAVNREIFCAMLEDTGLEIDIAENGRIAVEKFTAHPRDYDLILMDVQMPEMDGFEATRAIRAAESPVAARIPIIAMTANVFREDIEKCRACGMDDHIGKPVDYTEMMGKLRRKLLAPPA